MTLQSLQKETLKAPTIMEGETLKIAKDLKKTSSNHHIKSTYQPNKDIEDELKQVRGLLDLH
jgi:hypothetical protein